MVDTVAVYAVVTSMKCIADGNEEDEVPPFPLMTLACNGSLQAMQAGLEPSMTEFGHRLADWMAAVHTEVEDEDEEHVQANAVQLLSEVKAYADALFGVHYEFVAVAIPKSEPLWLTAHLRLE